MYKFLINDIYLFEETLYLASMIYNNRNSKSRIDRNFYEVERDIYNSRNYKSRIDEKGRCFMATLSTIVEILKVILTAMK